MQELLKPIKTESLKDVFIDQFEELILSGKIAIGQKLPSERDLAQQMNVSRPVVHEALVDLAAKGLISMKPRVGASVNDFRKEGSVVLLESLIRHSQGEYEPRLRDSMLQMRILLEMENVRLAATKRSQADLDALQAHLKKEQQADRNNIEAIIELDFAFHHLIALASGNIIYPLILNSFKLVYTHFTRTFYSDASVIPVAFDYHRRLTAQIAAKDGAAAAATMLEMLTHGESHLRKIYARQKEE